MAMLANVCFIQNNQGFISLSTEQVLTDLKLLNGGKLNYAALILLGKKGIIEQTLPQSKIVWESFATRYLEQNPDFSEAAVMKGIKRLLKDYPPKK